MTIAKVRISSASGFNHIVRERGSLELHILHNSLVVHSFRNIVPTSSPAIPHIPISVSIQKGKANTFNELLQKNTVLEILLVYKEGEVRQLVGCAQHNLLNSLFRPDMTLTLWKPAQKVSIGVLELEITFDGIPDTEIITSAEIDRVISMESTEKSNRKQEFFSRIEKFFNNHKDIVSLVPSTLFTQDIYGERVFRGAMLSEIVSTELISNLQCKRYVSLLSARSETVTAHTQGPLTSLVVGSASFTEKSLILFGFMMGCGFSPVLLVCNGGARLYVATIRGGSFIIWDAADNNRFLALDAEACEASRLRSIEASIDPCFLRVFKRPVSPQYIDAVWEDNNEYYDLNMRNKSLAVHDLEPIMRTSIPNHTLDAELNERLETLRSISQMGTKPLKPQIKRLLNGIVHAYEQNALYGIHAGMIDVERAIADHIPANMAFSAVPVFFNHGNVTQIFDDLKADESLNALFMDRELFGVSIKAHVFEYPLGQRAVWVVVGAISPS
ncbi:hypothetical protein PCE1_004434 [Barthelona sp. PCE]